MLSPNSLVTAYSLASYNYKKIDGTNIMAKRDYSIDFFTGNGTAGAKDRLAAFLTGLVETNPLVWQQKGTLYELKNLRAAGDALAGVFAKIRLDDLPHAGAAGGEERQLQLAENEGLIEKNHFLFIPQDNLLVFQRNISACSAKRFAGFISQVMGEVITFDPVLQRDAAARLMQGDIIPTELTLTFARPTHPAMFPDDEWGRSLLEVLALSGGSSVRLMITSDSRSTNGELNRLSNRLKRTVRAFAANEYTRTARMEVMDADGGHHPIDLLADRIYSTREVEMDGRYPNEASIYAALRDAFHDCRESIYEVLGPRGHRLN